MTIKPSSLELAQKALEILTPECSSLDRLPKKEKLQALLSRNGLGLEQVASNLSYLAVAAEREETRLRANELALKLHEVLKEEKEPSVPTIVFQVAGENVNLNFLRPQPSV